MIRCNMIEPLFSSRGRLDSNYSPSKPSSKIVRFAAIATLVLSQWPHADRLMASTGVGWAPLYALPRSLANKSSKDALLVVWLILLCYKSTIFVQAEF
eukprot:c42350_g1_i1 orf=130-423(+)